MKFKFPEDSSKKQAALLPGNNFLNLNVKADIPTDTDTFRMFHSGRFFRHSRFNNFGNDLLCGRKIISTVIIDNS